MQGTQPTMTTEPAEGKSLTDVAYWNNIWRDRPIPGPMDPDTPGLNGVHPRSFHRFFEAQVRDLGLKPGDLICEAGGGGSVKLPYLAKRWGLRAEVLDNSEEGCALSRAIADKAGIDTPVHCVDVFQPPEMLRERYRYVMSFGLAEHFRPTSLIINALSALIAPSGYIMTLVPNMRGSVGWVQKLVDPGVYNVHVPLSPDDLAAAHRECGLEVLQAGHLMTACYGVVNFSGKDCRVNERLGLRLASCVSKTVWLLESAGMPSFPNAVTSPYVYVIAQKPAGGRAGSGPSVAG